MQELKRKGARSIKEITPDILNQLNTGKIETANLVEWLAISQTTLLQNILKQHKRTKYAAAILDAVANLKKQTVNTIKQIYLKYFTSIQTFYGIVKVLSLTKN